MIPVSLQQSKMPVSGGICKLLLTVLSFSTNLGLQVYKIEMLLKSRDFISILVCRRFCYDLLVSSHNQHLHVKFYLYIFVPWLSNLFPYLSLFIRIFGALPRKAEMPTTPILADFPRFYCRKSALRSSKLVIIRNSDFFQIRNFFRNRVRNRCDFIILITSALENSV